MKEEIKQIMSTVFEIKSEDIPDDGEMNQIINWDSLNHISLVVALEEKYQVSFEPDEISTMVSVGKILQLIHKKTGTK